MSKTREAAEDLDAAEGALESSTRDLLLAISSGDQDGIKREARVCETARHDIAKARARLVEAEREEKEARQRKSKKATIRERSGEMICPECGGAVARKSKHGPTPIFCSPEHRRAFNNRMIVNGGTVLPYLLAWRVDRGSGEIASASFGRAIQILDSLIVEAREAHPPRPRADLYAAKLFGHNFQSVDELRYGRRCVADAKRRQAEADAQASRVINPPRGESE